MKLKKLLSLLILSPIIPIIGIPEGEGNNDGDGGENKNTDGNNDGNNSNNDNNDKLFSQNDLNSIVEKRLARERKSFEKEFNKKLEREKMDDIERMKAEKLDAEKLASETMLKANTRLIRSEIMVKAKDLNVIDIDAVYALINKEDISIDDSGNILGIDDALNDLISKKSWLVKSNSSNNQTGDDQNNNNNNQKKNFDFNEMIRKATGR